MIVEYKNRKQIFDSWFNTIYEKNFKDNEPKSAIVIWEEPSQVSFSKYKCDLDQMKWFSRQLQEYIKELEFDEFLRKNIQNYIEYIE